MVVGEQDGVDRADLAAGSRGPRLPVTRAPAEGVAPAGAVERGVGQQPPAADLDQDGRPSDVGEPDGGHPVLDTRRRRPGDGVLDGPVERVVGDLFPAVLGGQRCARPSNSFTSVTCSAL